MVPQVTGKQTSGAKASNPVWSEGWNWGSAVKLLQRSLEIPGFSLVIFGRITSFWRILFTGITGILRLFGGFSLQ